MPHLQRHAVSSWLERIDERAGPLREPAERFLRRRLGVEPSDFQGGPGGLLQLSRALEAWLETEDAEPDEDALVEEAGATLGLLLIGHLGSARHASHGGRHRVALGRHGFFDPFAAIERVLDADNVQRALAREVVAAEDEAGGRGSISRVIGAFCEQLAVERPHLRVASQFDSVLQLVGSEPADALEVDLGRVVTATRGEGEATLRDATRRLLAMLPGAPEARLLWKEARERIVPRLSRIDALDGLASAQRPPLFRRALRGELCVAFLVEHEGRARYLKLQEAREFGISEEALETQALDNLLARSTRFRLTTEGHEQASYLCARSGDGRDSARLLLDAVLSVLRERLGPDLCVAVPHRDTFFACAASDSAARAAMARRAREDRERAPHGLTASLLRLSGSHARLREE